MGNMLPAEKGNGIPSIGSSAVLKEYNQSGALLGCNLL